ncbi:MAG: hypothetical protein K2H72_07035 [Muribaculaceae bacterium]|nr:hypothetical protein [Muribaculaceae bacterium]
MKTSRYINIYTATTAVFVLLTYWLLAVKNGYMLRWYDEMSLFEPTRIFFRQSLYYPGGLLKWSGTWLTQLLYYPWLGSTALVVLWLLLAWLTRKAFRMPDAVAPLALLVPLAILVSVVQLDEAWLSLKSAGYVFSNTLGCIFTILIVLAYRLSGPRWMLCAAIAAASALCYFFVGFFGLLGASICAILAVCTAIRDRKYLNLTTAAIAIVLIAVIPPLYYHYFQGNTVDNDLLYLKGLPELMMEKFDIYLWKPFIAATAILLILALIKGAMGWKEGKLMKWIATGAVCVMAIWCFRADNKSEQLRATVLMLQKLERSDWAGMTGVMSRIKEPPNYTMRTLNNLAVMNQGGEWQSLKGYQPARGDGRHSEKFTMTAFANVPMCYNTGRFSESYRWAMEHTVQYGKRVFFLKYMVKNALLRGEIQLAKRYNDILKSTMFHRQWAEEMERYIDNPALIESNPDFNRIFELGKASGQQGPDGETADIH